MNCAPKVQPINVILSQCTHSDSLDIYVYIDVYFQTVNCCSQCFVVSKKKHKLLFHEDELPRTKLILSSKRKVGLKETNFAYTISRRFEENYGVRGGGRAGAKKKRLFFPTMEIPTLPKIFSHFACELNRIL